MPVGGITPSNMNEWREAGAAGFGIGSALFKPGKSAQAVRDDAQRFVAAYTGTTRA
jgi:2-dehydro-3-deoxyphosphogalactonate aldolase